MDFYRNLNEREKKLVLLSLGLLGILLISFLINSVSSDLRNVKRIHKSTESDYLYVLQKANIISANIESQNIKLSGVSIYEHISDNEKLKLLDQESIELRNINGRENLTFTISRLDLLTDVVNELSLFFNKNPYDIDMVVIRENTEGEYANVGGFQYLDFPEEIGIQTGVFTKKGCERVIRYAFQLAEKRNKKKKRKRYNKKD